MLATTQYTALYAMQEMKLEGSIVAVTEQELVDVGGIGLHYRDGRAAVMVVEPMSFSSQTVQASHDYKMT